MVRAQVAIFAHQEQRRIAGCINSLPVGSDDFEFHILVNGTTDRTAAIARNLTNHLPNVHVHDLPESGKARTWNHFLDNVFDATAPVVFFVDGDTEMFAGSLDAMRRALDDEPTANAVNALPLNGRTQDAYREQMLADHGMFGALYGLRGAFLIRWRNSGIRLPLDLIGDDGLIAALVKTDLRDEAHWDKTRVANCPDARFRFEETDWRVPATWALQWQRMVNYSVRRYQNKIISGLMRGHGPSALPVTMRETYAAHWHLFDIRPTHAIFDWLAKRRMK